MHSLVLEDLRFGNFGSLKVLVYDTLDFLLVLIPPKMSSLGSCLDDDSPLFLFFDSINCVFGDFLAFEFGELWIVSVFLLFLFETPNVFVMSALILEGDSSSEENEGREGLSSSESESESGIRNTSSSVASAAGLILPATHAGEEDRFSLSEFLASNF
jgi:hypothetical protein